MSSSTDIVIVLTKSSLPGALDVLESSLSVLIEDYDFGFRSYGEILGLDFSGRDFQGERELDDAPTSVPDIDRAALEVLAADPRWFSIGGSMRVEEVEALVDIDLILYPTFEPEQPACVVFRLESDIYDAVYGRGYDAEAAERLVKLCVSLGAVEGVDGFQARLVADLDDVEPLDAARLRHVMVELESIRADGPTPAIVVGARRDLVALPELRDRWKDGTTFETTSGFVVLSTLVDIGPPLQ